MARREYNQDLVNHIVTTVCDIEDVSPERLKYESINEIMRTKAVISKLCDFEEQDLVFVGINVFGGDQKATYALRRYYKTKDCHMVNYLMDRSIKALYRE